MGAMGSAGDTAGSVSLGVLCGNGECGDAGAQCRESRMAKPHSCSMSHEQGGPGEAPCFSEEKRRLPREAPLL